MFSFSVKHYRFYNKILYYPTRIYQFFLCVLSSKLSLPFDCYPLLRQEISIIRKKNAVLSGVAALEHTASPMAILVSVITVVLTGEPLTPVNVFMLISLVNTLRISICSFLAYGFLDTYDAYASLGRIEEFLHLENLPVNCRDQAAVNDGNTDGSFLNVKGNGFQTVHRDELQDVSVSAQTSTNPKSATLRVKGLAKKQMKREEKHILQNVEFTAESGSLTVITGPVGSGKSTLLSAIAGEVPDISGTISSKGTLVYVPQIPWVFSGTIRENILFGESYDEFKYTRIVEACALTEDLRQFPDRDQTVVGEHGEVLSGGQRARVSLARAVYADADVYLLDDPLSAVDFKVSQQIFEKCFKGLLGHKTRAITSHQEYHMKAADHVIVLFKGRVLGRGNFTELNDKGILNTTVDPLYKTLNGNNSGKSFRVENEEEDEGSDSRGGIIPQTNEAKGLQISKEDRIIGVVSSKLYWKYFRSGVPSLVIIAVLCLCLVTQGKPTAFF